MKIPNKIFELSEQYPFPGDTIFSLYQLIIESEEHYGMKKTEEEIFEILKRTLDAASIHSISPFAIVKVIYSDEVKAIFK